MKNINLKDISLGKKDAVGSIPTEKENNREIRKKDIAVIGMAVKVGSADNAEQFWKILENGTTDLNLPEEQRISDYYDYIESEGFASQKNTIIFKKFSCMKDIDKFDYSFFKINPNEAKLMDPKHRMFLQTSYNALEDAGYGGGNINGRKIGVFLGDSVNNMRYSELLKGEEGIDGGKSHTGNLNSLIPTRISYIMNLTGPTMYIDTGCSSALTGLHQAIQSLQNGDCEMAVVGGTSFVQLLPVKNLKGMKIQSDDGKTKAFDDFSDGTNHGEGSCAVVIKQLSKAKEDNDHIYAVIKGTAINNDGFSLSITSPNMSAQTNMLIEAWHSAGINPESISYIECHGTGTLIGDPIEANAIINAFEKYTGKKQFCGIGSAKSNFSHTGAIAGLVGLIKAILAMNNRMLPPTTNFDVPNSSVDFIDSPVYINSCLRKWEGELLRCGVSAFSLCGTNVHVVLEEYKDTEREYAEDKYKLLCISAAGQDSLIQLIRDYISYIRKNPKVSLSDLTYTVNTSRKNCEYRTAVVFSTRDELLIVLERLLIESEEIRPVVLKNDPDRSDPVIEECIAVKKTDRGKMEQLGYLYCEGYDINWNRLYDKKKYRRIKAPVYPFAKNRCWYEFSGKQKEYAVFERYCRDLIHDEMMPFELKSQIEKLAEEIKRYSEGNKKEMYTDLRLEGREDGSYNETEVFLAQKCYDVFGYNVIDIDSSFSSFNADSLQMTTLYAKIREHFNIGLTDLYENDSIRKLAEKLSGNEQDIRSLVETLIEESRDTTPAFVPEQHYHAEIEAYNEKITGMAPVDISKRKCYNNILLTGGTGYLGAYLLKELLEQTSSHVILLARADSDEKAYTRIRNNCEYYFGNEIFDKYPDRIEIFAGDLTASDLGLGERYSKLADTVDCILNSAANSGHFGEYRSFYEGNVVSTENIIAFANTGIKKTLNHISTYAVDQYRGPGNGGFLTEFVDVDVENIDEVENYYSKTKIIAENLINTAREEGLEARIFRVGSIFFEYERGVMQKNIENNAAALMIRSFVELGMIPDVDGFGYRFSYVDYTAKAIVMLMGICDAPVENYHISNTERRQLRNYLSDSRSERRIELLPAEDFLRKGLEMYENNDPRYELFNDLIIHSYDGGRIEKTDIDPMVGFSLTNTLLEEMGFSWPDLTIECFNRFIKYSISTGFIK